jgi:NADH-quinone oxidoreductase subunit G
MVVSPAFNRKLAETDCVNCGQCAAVCPTGAITVKKNEKEVWKAIYDPKKRVVVQVAPAVRVALGEEFGLEPGTNSIGKIFTAIRMLGVDNVYDTITDYKNEIERTLEARVLSVEKAENMLTNKCETFVKIANNYVDNYNLLGNKDSYNAYVFLNSIIDCYNEMVIELGY